MSKVLVLKMSSNNLLLDVLHRYMGIGLDHLNNLSTLDYQCRYGKSVLTKSPPSMHEAGITKYMKF
jgi:hypothetical protein